MIVQCLIYLFVFVIVCLLSIKIYMVMVNLRYLMGLEIIDVLMLTCFIFVCGFFYKGSVRLLFVMI